MNKITAVILAAGKGTRMKSELPKVLHRVAGKPMLARVIANIKGAGIADIITVVGYKGEEIKRLFERDTRFVEQKELLGSGHALAQAVDFLTDGSIVVVACGDAPLISQEAYKELLEGHLQENAACTVLTCEMDDPFSYGRIFRDDNGEVLKIVEEKDLAAKEEREIKEVNTGTYCFNAEDIKAFVQRIKINRKKNEFYLTDIVDILKKENRKVIARSCPARQAIGINSRRDISEATRMVNMDKIEQVMAEGVTVIDPATTFIADDAVIGKDTVIYPGTVIEEEVRTGNACKIGPMAHLRPGTELAEGVEIGNFTEINRTKIGQGSRVKHQAYLGDAIIGKNVNIGAGAVTANYDGKEKHTTVVEDSAFIGAGSRLVAPVRIGKGAVVGAGAVVTKGQEVKEGETVAGVPAKSIPSDRNRQ